MTRYIGFAVVIGAMAAALLVQLNETAELVAWEVLLVLLLVILIRLFPRHGQSLTPPLFGGSKKEEPHSPRQVASFELAAVHAFSESAGADRRMKSQLRRIAGHRMRRRGIRPGSPYAAEVIDPVLFDDRLRPLSRIQIERIVNQMENL